MSVSNLVHTREQSEHRTLLRRRAAWLLATLMMALVAPAVATVMGRHVPRHYVGTVAANILLLSLLVASYTDLRDHRIPNWLTYPAMVCGLALALWGGRSEPGASELLIGGIQPFSAWSGSIGMQSAVLGALACFGVMFLLYCLTGGGAGDVKLMTMIGLFVGPQVGFLVLIWSYLVATSLIVCWSVWKHGPIRLLRALGRKLGFLFTPVWVSPPDAEDRQLLATQTPLAPSFCLGTLIILLGRSHLWG